MPMSDQEIFDHVATNLLRQGVRSESERENKCLYRGPKRRRCAAGWLIHTKDYRKEMEGESIHSTTVQQAIAQYIGRPLEGKTFWLIRKLQRIHDFCHESRWQEALLKLGHELNLNTDCIKETA